MEKIKQYDTGNPFDKILKNQESVDPIYSDFICLSFLDIKPHNPGHTLIITKRRVESILELSKKEIKHIISVAHTISLSMSRTLSTANIRIQINNGNLAGQEIFHFHIHVIPFYHEDKGQLENREIIQKLKQDMSKNKKYLQISALLTVIVEKLQKTISKLLAVTEKNNKENCAK